MRQPTCFECLNAKIYPGCHATLYEPSEPAEAECRLIFPLWWMQTYAEELTEPEEAEALRRLIELEDKLWMYHDFELPEHCGRFDPVLVENCAECGQQIDAALWEWGIWAMDMYEQRPACSEACRQARNDVVALQIQELTGHRRAA